MKSLLKNAREQKGLKTRELAQLAGIDQALISKFESGTRKPTKDQIIKLSQLLEIDYETLMVAWLKEKILYEIGDEEFALKALLLAEQEIQKNKKDLNSLLLSSFESVLNEIELLKNKIQSFNHFELRQISKTLELEFIFRSIHFNGNSLTLEEIKSVINEGLTISGKSMQNHLEAINFQETIGYIKDLVQKKIYLNEKDFLGIHNLLFRGIGSENAGKYKNDSLILREMNLFFNWYELHKNNLNPIILASEAHLKILEINPFEYGNLQMANLILNWILHQYHYVFFSVEENQKSKDEYLSVLDESQIKNDKSIFINYILRIEKENLNRAIQLIAK
ncbi:transcriptional regulator with XRE-family HTH domain [Flavobacterium nitrogenifigens]|uniref:Transcriptional regulator with XRE-family HTH domain n=2 Tax=Flavobacterium TaxID=237 RepID=A0A7W7N7L9_9FLAO|nr:MULTISPECIES: helix-turn-helix domain-containing protein [Flavobacterium]MBB4802908.1 transcriptional regulator with XRE-family HTH domain [Flavobacterium nitrogenifigens]MBB6387866.1 transcriptional regulator with XRE-family HTH domain [Flavobacterium notoginsengisoli]